ncbi:UDP-N-acetylmuramoyl-tripeptide--D-alanyl-D-alanine ligase [Thiomicrospira microaerophila]|uniref:UDP-N-acetylmuramoyl-tripeptide--D-alanyl-D- alanine ligase n=1 Tax=Thiomicrospira microaerophila TaxID=406020 RepID=UPI00200C707E|nr:UDP-N-acetylmuramoyl-tripeptide--D-alanyl-D-alanine ligase [Thiomicrospira microaerophila]UQB41508.1 UDP-N-acetylmuramoyl-tripeptide--D-alanyl-D-alanine ligase [Thiomicrospira microaerophila]
MMTERIMVERPWTFEELAEVTTGTWYSNTVSTNCLIEGVTVLAGQHQPNNLVSVRSSDEKGGLPLTVLKSLHAKTPVKYLMCTTPMMDEVSGFNLPILVVKNLTQAVIEIGTAARVKMRGTVIGVTGSAGKTTMTAMLAQMLSVYGSVVSTQLSANLPFGIAWNLASVKPSTDYAVMEMAIGNMLKNSKIVRPDIAVFTNIGAAHLEYHSTTEDVATKKSRIFQGMAPGGWAVLNRDMQHWEIVSQYAQAAELNILSYGVSGEADVKLIGYQTQTGQVDIELNGMPLSYHLTALGKHMVLNSMACIAVSSILLSPAASNNINLALEELNRFSAVDGRGKVHHLTIQSKSFTLVDEAYNANPLSIISAIDLFKTFPEKTTSRVLILGDMLELGQDSVKLHLELVPVIESSGADTIYLYGQQMKQVYECLNREKNHVFYFETLTALQAEILANLKDKSLLLIKSSNGMGLHKLVKNICDLAE